MKYNIIVKDNSILESYNIEFTDEELLNEEWRQLIIPKKYENMIDMNFYGRLFDINNKIYVSNLGRIAKMDKDNNLILNKVYKGNDNYKHISLFEKSMKVHRLIAFVFINNDDYKNRPLINHKDLCQYNNRIENLEWCCDVENRNWRKNEYPKRKVHNEGMKVTHEVLCINLKNNEEKIFKNPQETAEYIGCKRLTVSRCILNKIEKIISEKGEFKCKYLNMERGKSSPKSQEPIVQLDINEKFINLHLTYKTIQELEYVNIIDHINQCCKKNMENNTSKYASKNYKWMFLRQYNEYYKNKIINFNPIILDFKIVELTRRNKFVKYYDNIYDIINIGFKWENVYNMCCKGTKVFYENKMVSLNTNIKRKWMFLNDYLTVMNINDLSELNINDISESSEI